MFSGVVALPQVQAYMVTLDGSLSCIMASHVLLNLVLKMSKMSTSLVGPERISQSLGAEQ